jgi:hypothetical protein
MRKRYVMMEGELVEVPHDYDNSRNPNTDAVLWNDRLYQDGNDPRFASRAQHREFMKQRGLTTIDDFQQTFADKAKERVEIRNGTNQKYRNEIKQDVIETVRKFDATRRR